MENIDKLYSFFTYDNRSALFLNNSFVSAEHDRLKQIKQLGAISLIFNQADYNSFEHHIGIFALLVKLERLTSLPSELKIQPLRYASLIHAIGHLPFAQCSEKYLLYSCNTSKLVFNELENLLSSTITYTDNLGIFSHDDFNNIIYDLNHAFLHKIITAYKIFSNVSKLRKSKIKDHEINNIIRYILDSSSFGSSILKTLNRIDFIIRDMHSIGVFYPKLNYDYYFSNIYISRGKSGYEVILPDELNYILNGVELYANDNIYYNNIVNAIECSIGKCFSRIIEKEPFLISDMLNYSDSDFILLLNDNNYDPYSEVRNIKSDNFNIICQSQYIANKKINAMECEIKTYGTIKNVLSTMPIKKGIYTYVHNLHDSNLLYECDLFVDTIKHDAKTLSTYFVNMLNNTRYELFEIKMILLKYIFGNRYKKLNTERYENVAKKIWKKIEKERSFNDLKDIISVYKENGIERFNPRLFIETLIKSYITDVSQAMKNALNINYKLLVQVPELLSHYIYEIALKYSPLSDIDVKREMDVVYGILARGKRYCSEKEYDKIMCYNSVELNRPEREIDAVIIYMSKNRKMEINLIESSIDTGYKKQVKSCEKMTQIQQIITERFKGKVEIKSYFNDEIMI